MVKSGHLRSAYRSEFHIMRESWEQIAAQAGTSFAAELQAGTSFAGARGLLRAMRNALWSPEEAALPEVGCAVAPWLAAGLRDG